MATGSQLLSTLSTSGTNSYITIDTSTRQITIPSGTETIGVYSDDDTNVLYFQISRYFKNLDLSSFDISINYSNAAGDADRYAVTDKEVSTTNITFSWTIGRMAYEEAGSVTFAICFRLYDTDGSTVIQEYNSTTASLTVLAGLESTEAIIQPYTDYVEQLTNEFKQEMQDNITEIENTYATDKSTWDGEVSEAVESANDAATNATEKAEMGNKAIAFHGTSGVQLGWLASQADMLAEDWVEAD